MTLQVLKGTTPGDDKITYSMLKSAADSLKNRICSLYNNILRTGIFPHDWKKAILKPIPKTSRNYHQVDGYRPVSLLPVLSKIFEKIIGRRIGWLMEKRISNEQHAFRPNRGVQSLIHLMEHKLADNLSCCRHSVVMSSDLEKAFDRVTTFPIIEQLHKWGVPEQMLKVIISFLSGRTFCVEVNGFTSKTLKLENGTPQGSPLSVYLYNAYIDALITELVQPKYGLDFVGVYVDNIFMVASGDPSNVNALLQSADTTIYSWTQKTGAIVPPSKIEALHLCRKKKCTPTPLVLRNSTVTLKKELRVLGVTFSGNLKWDLHIKNTINQLKNRNNALKLICSRRKGPHIETALKITNTLVEGTLQHGLTHFMWTSKKNLESIDIAINECYRTSTGALRTTPIEALRIEAGYKSINRLGQKRAVNLISKALTDMTHPLHTASQECLRRKKQNRKNSISSLSKILTLISAHGCIPLEIPQILSSPPPWKRHLLPIDISLSSHNKENTPHQYFRKLHQDLIETLKPIRTLYTDGSYKDNNSTYAVIELKANNEETIIFQGLLPDAAGSYIAEVTALLKALLMAQTWEAKTLILTDSLSILTGIKSATNNCPNLNYIRSILYNNDNISLAWIPGHSGIKGNEVADTAAKEATRYPYVKELPNIPQLIRRVFIAKANEDLESSWQDEQNFLRKHHFTHLRTPYNKILTREECISLFRIRVGKTLFTSRHYFTKEAPEECENCREILSIWHIFAECPISHQTKNTDSTEEKQKQLAKILNPSDVQTIQRIKEATTLHNKFKDI